MNAEIISVKPIVLPSPGRGADLRVKVTAPVAGRDLPVILFSHGYGSSMEGYGPLADHWAAHGFVVVQPTHLDALPPGDPRTPRIWRLRVEDLSRVLDHLDLLETAVPGLRGRVDRSRTAAAGHSFGGQTAGNLLGLRVLDAEDLSDPRIGAGVLLATAGQGGADLTPFAAEHYPFMNPGFAGMKAPALVIAGDRDDSPLSVRGPDWMTDPYHLSPGRKSLLTLFGAEHSLGGIPGYDARETTDENPDRVALIQRVTTAYLRHELGIDSAGWPPAVDAGQGRLESR